MIVSDLEIAIASLSFASLFSSDRSSCTHSAPVRTHNHFVNFHSANLDFEHLCHYTFFSPRSKKWFFLLLILGNFNILSLFWHLHLGIGDPPSPLWREKKILPGMDERDCSYCNIFYTYTVYTYTVINFGPFPILPLSHWQSVCFLIICHFLESFVGTELLSWFSEVV